jgi:hypothetical protein
MDESLQNTNIPFDNKKSCRIMDGTAFQNKAKGGEYTLQEKSSGEK